MKMINNILSFYTLQQCLLSGVKLLYIQSVTGMMRKCTVAFSIPHADVGSVYI